MTLLNWLFPRREAPGVAAAKRAIEDNRNLLQRMREYSNSDDPARALMADIWLQRHNVPYITTMYESRAELNAATQYSDRNAHNDNGKP